MGKKSRKHVRKLDFILDDEYDNLPDSDLDLDSLARDIHSTDWGNYNYEQDSRSDARRKIEHRRDMKKLYSQLDDWEEFGAGAERH